VLQYARIFGMVL